MVAIPLNAVPIIGVSTTTTTLTTTGEIPAATLVTAPDAAEKLVKAMEDMNLQGEEIRKLHEEIRNLQKMNSTFQASCNIEMHKLEKLK